MIEHWHMQLEKKTQWSSPYFALHILYSSPQKRKKKKKRRKFQSNVLPESTIIVISCHTSSDGCQQKWSHKHIKLIHKKHYFSQMFYLKIHCSRWVMETREYTAISSLNFPENGTWNSEEKPKTDTQKKLGGGGELIRNPYQKLLSGTTTLWILLPPHTHCGTSPYKLKFKLKLWVENRIISTMTLPETEQEFTNPPHQAPWTDMSSWHHAPLTDTQRLIALGSCLILGQPYKPGHPNKRSN